MVLEFGFVVSIVTVTVTVIVIVIVIAVVDVDVDVPVLVPTSLQSSVYKPPASVSGRLGVRK